MYSSFIHFCRNVDVSINLIFESQSALQSWSFIINCIGKEKLKHHTTELFRKGLVVLSRQVHAVLNSKLATVRTFRISAVRWPIYIINSVDKTKFLYSVI